MNAIGNIYLTWRKGKGERRIPVGIIRKNKTNGTRFNYHEKGLIKAKSFGFIAYEGFPDTSKTYSENVIDIFSHRLMQSERNDIKNFYDFWKIDQKHKKDDYYMLAYTQGILPTDNYEFLADFNPVKNLSFITEISGLSKIQIPTSSVNINDILRYEKETPENLHDKYAIKVFKDNLFLGYIKIIHNRVFNKTKKSLKVTVHHIEQNGRLSRVFLHVSN